MTPQEWLQECKTQYGAASRALSVIRRRRGRQNSPAANIAVYERWVKRPATTPYESKRRREAQRRLAYYRLMDAAEEAQETFLTQQVKAWALSLEPAKKEVAKQ